MLYTLLKRWYNSKRSAEANVSFSGAALKFLFGELKNERMMSFFLV